MALSAPAPARRRRRRLDPVLLAFLLPAAVVQDLVVSFVVVWKG